MIVQAIRLGLECGMLQYIDRHHETSVYFQLENEVSLINAGNTREEAGAALRSSV
jgi:hypothetical protein